MKKLLVMLFLCIFGFNLVACSNIDLPSLATEGVLVVGMECDYAPFNWTEATPSETNVEIVNVPGSYAEGYDVQIAKEIAKALNLTLQIKAMKWEALVPALKSGMIDLIIAGMSPTAEKMKSISFTNGYYRSTHVVLVKANSIYADATQFVDFEGAKIAGQLNTIYASLVPQMVSQGGAIAATAADTVTILVTQVKNGIIDGTILEEPVAKGYCTADSSLTYVKIEGGFDVNDEDVLVSIGVRKECNFIDKLNNALSSISDDMRNSMMIEAINRNANK